MLRGWICCPDLFSLFLFSFFFFCVFLEDNMSFVDARAPAKRTRYFFGEGRRRSGRREKKRGGVLYWCYGTIGIVGVLCNAP